MKAAAGCVDWLSSRNDNEAPAASSLMCVQTHTEQEHKNTPEEEAAG